uniref:Uncharacterized protein n=1 Tax=Glossina austeni TaxID=7395 RepID=A0A1A9UVM9_GLOAU
MKRNSIGRRDTEPSLSGRLLVENGVVYLQHQDNICLQSQANACLAVSHEQQHHHCQRRKHNHHNHNHNHYHHHHHYRHRHHRHQKDCFEYLLKLNAQDKFN